MKQRLKSIYLVLIFSVVTNLSIGQCLPSWKHFKLVTVVNNTTSNLTDFQVKLVVNTADIVSAGKMNASGDDIRFVDSGSCNTLPYWIESGMNTKSTAIWFKMPLLPASDQRVIKMYYDNSSASAMSNGDSTFIVFDDFNGTTINASKWNTFTTNGGKFTLSGGILTSSTNLEANLISKSSFATPLIEESKVTAVTGSWASLGILIPGTLDGYTMFEGDIIAGSNTMYLSKAFKPNNPSAISYTGSPAFNKPSGSLPGIWQLMWPSSNEQYANWPGGNMAMTGSSLTLPKTVQIAVGNIDGATGTMSVDWVRARKYAPKDATAVPDIEEYNNHTSGIQDYFLSNEVNIYPNPSNRFITIDLSKTNILFEKFDILDVNGKTLQTVKVEKENKIEISTAGLPNGMYFVRLTGSGNSVIHKFFKD